MRGLARSIGQHALVVGLLVVAVRARRGRRLAALAGLATTWGRSYLRYRARGRTRTAEEYERLRTANWTVFEEHYNERVPTIEEEFALWGAYHQHRHELRYGLVAEAVRQHASRGGRILDLGCGSALVADRIQDLDATYVGLEYGHHHITYPAEKYRAREDDIVLRPRFVRGQAERLPFADATFDIVVMSEVIEHLLRPEDAVWEVARVLKTGGVHIMTTNNASELPLRSPVVNPGAWIEKAVGFGRPGVISHRPWVWPEPMPGPSDQPTVFLPHTHHIAAETAALYAAAGLDVFHTSTFEFPPPQSATARVLDSWGATGRTLVDAVEAIASRMPVVRRLGTHLFVLARKNRAALQPVPPSGLWPGPFS